MIRIFIENKELDVLQDFSHQITYNIDDIANIDTKTTSFSKTIVLPGTANNNQLLGNIFEFSNSNFTNDSGANVGYNFNASKSAKVRVESNGLQIMKGVLRLLEIVIDGNNIEYEVGLFGELGGFVSALGTKRLEDLDFSTYDHFYSENFWEPSWQQGRNWSLNNVTFNTNYFLVYGKTFTELYENDIITITNSDGKDGSYLVDHIVNGVYSTTIYIKSTFPNRTTDSFDIQFPRYLTSGYYYPLIDYGKVSTNKHDYQYTALRPALFVRDYIKKIIANSGYTYECDFFNTDVFRRLVIPNNDKQFVNKNQASYVDATLTNDYVNTFPGFPYQKVNLKFTNTTLNLFTYASGTGIYTYNEAAARNVKLSGTLKYDGATSNQQVLFQIFKNGSVIYTYEFERATNIIFNYSVNVYIDTRDRLEFAIVGPVADGTSYIKVYKIGSSFNIKNAASTQQVINYDDIVIMNDSLPSNIFQKDFFISIMKMFNLMVVEDKYREKHLKIIPYTLFYDLDNTSYLDWTSKVDRSEPIRIKPMSEVNSRYYELKYKSDSDYYNDKYKKKYNQGYGDIKFDNNLEFVKDTQSSEVIFASTPLVGYEDEDKIVPTIFKWDGSINIDGEQSNEDTTASVLRIMQIKNVTGVTSWDIKNDTTVIQSYTTYPYAGHLDDPDAPNADINFGALNELYFTLASGALGNNLFNAFYSPYLAEITDKDSRMVSCKMKFTETDIFNLDFSKFIWIDQVLYRLNKIYDYTPNELCKVDLLRVIYTTYEDLAFQQQPASVQIGTQRWTSENLKQTSFLNGDAIPLATNGIEWTNYISNNIPCYAFRDFDENNFNQGLFYNIYALRDERGLGYYGWRMPTIADKDILKAFVSAAYPSEKSWTLKSTTSWATANGTNRYGFNAKGLGICYSGGFNYYGVNSFFALSNSNFTEQVIDFDADQDTFEFLWSGYDPENYGINVRLIKI